MFRKFGPGWGDHVGFWTVPYPDCNNHNIPYTHPVYGGVSVHTEADLEEMVRIGEAKED